MTYNVFGGTLNHAQSNLYLELGADLRMAMLIPLPLTISCSSKSRLVLPFWFQLTRVVEDKGPLNLSLIHI